LTCKTHEQKDIQKVTENYRKSLKPDDIIFQKRVRTHNNDNWIKEVGQLCDEIIRLNSELHSKLKIIKDVKTSLFSEKISKVKVVSFLQTMMEEVDRRISEVQPVRANTEEVKKTETVKVYKLIEARSMLSSVYDGLTKSRAV
jgi:hypothetical protein